MRGELLPVWTETWREIWSKLAKHPDAPDDLFSELYREFAQAFSTKPTPEALADVVGVATRARSAFRNVKVSRVKGEAALVGFLERAHSVVADLGGDPLANRYFILVEEFLTKFSLRYDLRRPFTLHPTLPGVFARMVTELKAVTRARRSSSPTDGRLRELRPRLACGRFVEPNSSVHPAADEFARSHRAGLSDGDGTNARTNMRPTRHSA